MRLSGVSVLAALYFLCPKASIRGVLKKRCSSKFRKFDRKTPVLESLFNEVAGLWGCHFIKRKSIRDVFLWNLRNF